MRKWLLILLPLAILIGCTKDHYVQTGQSERDLAATQVLLEAQKPLLDALEGHLDAPGKEILKIKVEQEKQIQGQLTVAQAEVKKDQTVIQTQQTDYQNLNAKHEAFRKEPLCRVQLFIDHWWWVLPILAVVLLVGMALKDSGITGIVPTIFVTIYRVFLTVITCCLYPIGLGLRALVKKWNAKVAGTDPTKAPENG